MTELTLGKIGSYRLLNEIGRGGMGIVYEARDESSGRIVAIKVMPGTFGLGPHNLERFRREAQAAARIDHPAVVPVYDVGSLGGMHYVVMKRLPGPNLQEGPRREWREVTRSIAEVADALEVAHQAGIIHRDVTPSNLITREDGGLALSDFGLAKLQDAASLTFTGENLGTPRYMSPEQIEGGEVTVRSDVYQLGLTLWEALAGRHPYDGLVTIDQFRASISEDPPSPRSFNRAVPPEVAAVALKAMARKPEDRYPSAAEFGADLRRALAGEPVSAPVERGAGSAARRVRSLVQRTGFAATSIIILLIGLFIAFTAGLLAGSPGNMSLGSALPIMLPFGFIAFATAVTGMRYPSRWRPFDELSVALTGLIVVFLFLAGFLPTTGQPVYSTMEHLYWNENLKLYRVLWLFCFVLAAAGSGVLASGRRVGFALAAAAHLWTFWVMRWWGPEQIGIHAVILALTGAGCLWRPVGDWLRGCAGPWRARSLVYAAFVALGVVTWILWKPYRETQPYVVSVYRAGLYGPNAQEIQYAISSQPGPWPKDLYVRPERLRAGLVPPRTPAELRLALSQEDHPLSIYWRLASHHLLVDLINMRPDPVELGDGREWSAVENYLQSRRRGDLSPTVLTAHRQSNHLNTYLAEEWIMALEALREGEPVNEPKGDSKFLFSAAVRAGGRLERAKSNGERNRMQWQLVRRTDFLLAVHRAGRPQDTEWFRGLLGYDDGILRTLARHFLAERLPGRRREMLSAMLAEEHFDSHPVAAYVALQSFLEGADGADGDRQLKQFRARHDPDRCRIVVDCVLFSRGQEGAEELVRDLVRLGPGWGGAITRYVEIGADGLARRTDSKAFDLQREAFVLGWALQMAPSLARYEAGRRFLENTARDEVSSTTVPGLFHLPVDEIPGLAAKAALGNEGDVKRALARMKQALSPCFTCQRLRWKLAKAEGSREEVEAAGLALLRVLPQGASSILSSYEIIGVFDDIRHRLMEDDAK